MSDPASPSASNPGKPASSESDIHPPSLDDQLDRLTTAIQEVGESIHECKTASDERHALKLAHDDKEGQRTLTVQEQLAQMLAMTQESLRRSKEEPVVGAVSSASQTFARDLQRAAFGSGGSVDTASRSSMLESSRESGSE
ncbi:hypothetical protein C8Q80DRAFT_1266384 [Daedaleopsis nitida]|nr:hypothetical protein C8Q80DRAFT_1266384 [Daedaleopsis nitida]